MQTIFYWSNFPLTQEIFLVVYILRKGGRNLPSSFLFRLTFSSIYQKSNIKQSFLMFSVF